MAKRLTTTDLDRFRAVAGIVAVYDGTIADARAEYERRCAAALSAAEAALDGLGFAGLTIDPAPNSGLCPDVDIPAGFFADWPTESAAETGFSEEAAQAIEAGAGHLPCPLTETRPAVVDTQAGPVEIDADAETDRPIGETEPDAGAQQYQTPGRGPDDSQVDAGWEPGPAGQSDPADLAPADITGSDSPRGNHALECGERPDEGVAPEVVAAPVAEGRKPCPTCGGPLSPSCAARGATKCVRCRRAQAALKHSRICATPGCTRPLRSDNTKGVCGPCQSNGKVAPGSVPVAPRTPTPKVDAPAARLCLSPGCDRRLNARNTAGFCALCQRKNDIEARTGVEFAAGNGGELDSLETAEAKGRELYPAGFVVYWGEGTFGTRSYFALGENAAAPVNSRAYARHLRMAHGWEVKSLLKGGAK